MFAIILEGVLFVALIATVVTLVGVVVVQYTPVGVRLGQTRNRRRIDRAVHEVCPIHGPRPTTDLVRLPSGAVICPECYKETFHA